MQLLRKKPRNYKLSLAYKLVRFWPVSPKRKLKLLLDLSWIFSRLAHESIFKTDINLKLSDEDDIIVTFIAQDASVLDIGCGHGGVIRRILKKTKNIVGVDYDAYSINKAKERFQDTGVVLICDDIFNYLKQQKDTNFDYIILSHVLEHIDEPELFLKSLKGFAKNFYIEVPDFESTHLNLYRKHVGTDLIYSDADHVSEFTRVELEKIIISCGLQIVKSEFRFGVMKYWCSQE